MNSIFATLNQLTSEWKLYRRENGTYEIEIPPVKNNKYSRWTGEFTTLEDAINEALRILAEENLYNI